MAGADDVVKLTYDKAVALLPPEGRIHTFLDGGIALIGADWDRGQIHDLLRTGRPERSGPAAAGMGHGLVAFRGEGIDDPVFIETRADL